MIYRKAELIAAVPTKDYDASLLEYLESAIKTDNLFFPIREGYALVAREQIQAENTLIYWAWEKDYLGGGPELSHYQKNALRYLVKGYVYGYQYAMRME